MDSDDEDEEILDDGDLPDDAWTVGISQATDRASERADTASLASTIRPRAKKAATAFSEPKRPKAPVTLKEDDFRIVTLENSKRVINPLATELVEKAMRENLEKMLPKLSEADRNSYVRKYNLKLPPSLAEASTARLSMSNPVSILPPPGKVPKALTHQQRLLNLRRPRTRPFMADDVYIWRENGLIEAWNNRCPPPPVPSLVLGEYGANAQSATSPTVNSTSGAVSARDRFASSSSQGLHTSPTAGIDVGAENVDLSPRDPTATDSFAGVDLSNPFRRPVRLSSSGNMLAPTSSSESVPVTTRSATAPTTSTRPSTRWTISEDHTSAAPDPEGFHPQEAISDPFAPQETNAGAADGTPDLFQVQPVNFSATDPFRLPETITDPFRLPPSSTDPFNL